MTHLPADSSAVDPAAATNCAFIESLVEAETVRDEWLNLAESSGQAGPFSQPDYALAWWKHLGKGNLLIATARVRGELVALAPLHTRRLGPIQVARWLGHGLGTVSEPLVAPGHEAACEAMWEQVLHHCGAVHLLEARSGVRGMNELLKSAERMGLRSAIEEHEVCPVTVLCDEDGKDVVTRRGKKGLRKLLKKANREVEESGAIWSMQVSDTPEDFERLLPDVRAIFDAAEAEEPRQHFLTDPLEEFTLTHLRSMAQRNAVLTAVGYLDERPVSFTIGYLSESTLWLWLARYVPGTEEFSPGHLVRRGVFEWAAEHGRDSVDQLIGASQAKMKWADSTYDTYEIKAGSSGAVRVLNATMSVTAGIRDFRDRG